MIAAAARIYRSIWSLHGRNLANVAGYSRAVRGAVEGPRGIERERNRGDEEGRKKGREPCTRRDVARERKTTVASRVGCSPNSSTCPRDANALARLLIPRTRSRD